MSVNNAHRFVEKLRQDQNFRKNALATKGPEDSLSFLQKERPQGMSQVIIAQDAVSN